MKKVFKLYLMLFLSITGTVFTTNAETKKISLLETVSRLMRLYRSFFR